MRLKNKKTGEIGYLIVGKGSNHYVVTNDDWGNCGEYNSLAELNEEWERYEEPKEFYYITGDGYITKDNDTVTKDFADDLESIGNYFETKEEAEKAVEKLKAWKRLKDKGLKFKSWGWEDPSDNEYTIYFTLDSKSGDAADLDLLFGGEE